MSALTLRATLDLLGGSTHGMVIGVPPHEVRLHYPELLHRITSAAHDFLRRGVRPGDRVVMRIGSVLSDLVAMLGVVYLGAVPVSIKPNVPGTVEVSYIDEVARQQDARYAHGLIHPTLRPLDLFLTASSPAKPADVTAPDETAFIQYTSGSTGAPRPVPLSNRAMLTDIRGIDTVVGLRQDRTRATGSSDLLGSWHTIYFGAETIHRKTVQLFLDAAQRRGFSSSALTFCYGLAEATLLATAHRYVNDSRSYDITGHGPGARLPWPPVPRCRTARVSRAGGRIPEWGATDAAAIAAGITSAFGIVPTSVLEVRRQAIVRTASGKPVRTKWFSSSREVYSDE